MNIETFKNEINIGDIFTLPTAKVGFGGDFLLPETMDFTVYKKHEHIVELHHTIRNNRLAGIHKFTPSYVSLYLLLYSEGENE